MATSMVTSVVTDDRQFDWFPVCVIDVCVCEGGEGVRVRERENSGRAYKM